MSYKLFVTKGCFCFWLHCTQTPPPPPILSAEVYNSVNLRCRKPFRKLRNLSDIKKKYK